MLSAPGDVAYRMKWKIGNRVPEGNHCLDSSSYIQEGLAVASIARDDPSTLPGDDPIPRTRMHRDRNAR